MPPEIFRAGGWWFIPAGGETFVWNGRDRITDFELASQTGNDVVIRAGTDHLVIEDIRLNQLGRDDFVWQGPDGAPRRAPTGICPRIRRTGGQSR